MHTSTTVVVRVSILNHEGVRIEERNLLKMVSFFYDILSKKLGSSQMKYISIPDYAKRENISTKAVYARIKKGTVFSTTKDGKKYVIEEEKDCTSEQKKITELSKEIKELKSKKKPTENAIDITPYQTEIQDLKNELEKVKIQKQKVVIKKVKEKEKWDMQMLLGLSVSVAFVSIVIGYILGGIYGFKIFYQFN